MFYCFRMVIADPKCAFGDLIAASGITDEMFDRGLPPLHEIEDLRYETSR